MRGVVRVFSWDNIYDDDIGDDSYVCDDINVDYYFNFNCYCTF